MGAWIETNYGNRITTIYTVAPYMGAWIETTFSGCFESPTFRRSLYGSVD